MLQEGKEMRGKIMGSPHYPSFHGAWISVQSQYKEEEAWVQD